MNQRLGCLAMFVFFVFFVFPVFAMGIRIEREVLAQSGDGNVQLIKETGRGPEGGRTLSFVIQNGNATSEFRISDTLSPGGGSIPERVPAQMCVHLLQKLKKDLPDLQPAWKIHPEKCYSFDRDKTLQMK